MGCLLADGLRVRWIDGSFDGGALARYHDVPANTKVDILSALGTPDFLPGGLPSGRASHVLEEMAASAWPIDLPDDPAEIGWTGLDRCHDFFTALTASLNAILGAI